MRTVVLYRGRFDPPGQHHVEVLRALLLQFNTVRVVPWGPLADRRVDENVNTVHRARLIDLAFGHVDRRVDIDLRDLEHLSITPSSTLEEELRAADPDLQVVHAVEWDSFLEDCARLHTNASVVIVAPLGALVPDEAQRPPVVRVATDVSGKVMRKRLYEASPVDDLVPVAVANDIARYGLYRGTEPRSETRLALPASPKIFVSADERNPSALALRERLRDFLADDVCEADAIVVVGGDGSMLHAIQTHWRRRVPFIGLNAGHLGCLLNDVSAAMPTPEGGMNDTAAATFLAAEFVVYHLPMLHVELLGKDGRWTAGLTFNDAWIERSTGQSAWLEVTVDNHVRLEKLVCDGILVSTAAGSTAYARSMGAPPLLADTPAWLLVGSNVMDPLHWKSALLARDSCVEVRSLHVDKRPLVGFLHGVSMGEVTAMRVRLSRAASAEVCFLGVNDLTEKIARVQFPSTVNSSAKRSNSVDSSDTWRDDKHLNLIRS